MRLASAFLLLPLCVPAVVGCQRVPDPPVPTVVADAIYSGGPIVTVDDDQPTAEALAIKDGRILAVGDLSTVTAAHLGEDTEQVDLRGRTLVPGFVDGHAHVLSFGSQAVGANLLAAPDGQVETVDDLVVALSRFAEGPDVQRTGWIFGLGYDDAILGRHPTRDDLDQVSTEVPVIAVHISGHLAALNSVGLAQVGYTADTPDPEGGVIRRRSGSREPNGVLEELAAIPVMMTALQPRSRADQDHFLREGLELAKRHGYTTATEGRMMAGQHPGMLDAAARGLLDIDVLAYVDYTAVDVLPAYSPTYEGRFRVAGMKITLDGSPQGRTAWRTVPYLIPPDGREAGYRGYPVIPDTAEVTAQVIKAYRNGWPVQVHANGDAAIDQMIEAVRAARAEVGEEDRRTALIHGQFLRQDQIPELKALQILPSLFPMHTFYWGDWYDRIIGPERAQQISPMRSVLDAGMIATSHTDAPVALPNLMQVMWATVNRVSRSGKVMGPDERVTRLEALKAITLWGAWQHDEDDRKGSLEVGKLADLVILSDNPLTIDPMRIHTIEVLQTIKDGETVFRRAP